MSLRARLSLGTALAIALTLCAGLAAAYFVVRGQLLSEIDGALKERSYALASFPRRSPPPSLPKVSLPAPKLGGAAGYIQFVDRDGTISLPTGERTRLPSKGAREVAAGVRRPFFSEARVDGTHIRIYTAKLDGATAVQIARPMSEIDHVLSYIRGLFLLVAVVTVACAAALGLAVARAALRPVRRLTDDAEHIAATGDLQQRTDADRTDELGRLARAFNTMLDALARSVTAQRQLVADASHELRTPLASARANLDLVELHENLPRDERQRLVGEASVELRELTHLIDELVELARGDAHAPPKERLRLDHLVAEVVETAARRYSTPFELDLESTLVEAAPASVTRAIANLVDNAVKWSPEGAPVEVRARNGVVTVRDHGHGIDPADLPHIFDRFYRAASARTLPGSGLGLAIVRQVAEAHGGTVSVEPALGGGSVLTFRLPTVHEPRGTARPSVRQPPAPASQD